MNIAADGQIERLLRARDRDGWVAVEAGPFAGLRLLTRSLTTGHLAKVLGVYETQLIAPLQQAAARNPVAVLNIGCGDGYYLAACARLMPQARLIGFEADDTTRAEAQAVIAANGLQERTRLEGFCDIDLLRRTLPANALLLVDCEGGEVELLDPAQAPLLAGTAMLVELHESQRPGVSELLRQRFATTHRIEIIDQQSPLPIASRDVAALPETVVRAVVSERRSELMQWGWFEPKQGG